MNLKLIFLGLSLISATFASASPSEADLDRIARKLHRAYPGIVQGRDGNFLLFTDGTRLPLDDGRSKDYYERLGDADIEDMFFIPYRTGPDSFTVPAVNEDAGRIRCRAFFEKVYGKIVPAKNSADVTCPEAESKSFDNPLKAEIGGRTVIIRLNPTAGAKAAMQRVLEALRRLPGKEQEYASVVEGAFNARLIRKNDFEGKVTKGLPSAHSWGIAIDVRPPEGHSDKETVFRYWVWDIGRQDALQNHDYLTVMPRSVVEAFENEGFIWGGKWHHYDPMHFEYRPELLEPPS